MIRLATEQDILWLIEQMLIVKSTTAWKDVPGAYHADTLRPFLLNQLRAADSVCYVWDDPVDAFCGVTYGRMHVPPHLPYVFEWGWAGPPKHAVACWRACTHWATRRGAVLACRSVSQPGVSIRETLTWERL